MIGGLLTSTLLTLIVLPIVYEWLEERWPGWARQFGSDNKTPRPSPESAQREMATVVHAGDR